MKIKNFPLLLFFFCNFASASICERFVPIDTKNYGQEIAPRAVTFIAYSFDRESCYTINQPAVDERHTPYSTFKIPHTLIALETGAVSSADERFEWDQLKHPAKDFWPETWKRPHTLASAFKHSAVWYYKELVPRIKPQQYKEWLEKFSYGNRSFEPGSNEFWLNGELKISPLEQVKFLKCLVDSGCGVKSKTLSTFELIGLQETKNGLSLYGKTGAGPVDPDDHNGAFEGWYIGYIKKNESGAPIVAFAIYVESSSFKLLRDFRKDFSLRILNDLGFWKP